MKKKKFREQLIIDRLETISRLWMLLLKKQRMRQHLLLTQIKKHTEYKKKLLYQTV
jgi:hypothetical protein